MSDNTESGFTIVELVLSLVVGSMLSLTVIAFTFSYYMDTMRAQAETNMLIESQIILRRVADDMRYSSSILTTNTIADANEPSGGWNTSNDDLILILSTPAADSQGDFIDNEDQGTLYQNEFIYFADGQNFYKRVLANSGASDNRLLTNCPAASASASCPADPLLSEDFSAMSFIFYDQNGDVTNDPTLGRSVDIIIELEKTVFGETLSVENQIRMTLRNPFLDEG